MRVTPDAVQLQLDRIMASRAFDASARNRSFLRYVVNETLGGRGDRIKAYEIAVTVFGRDDSFDAQSDPIVRIEASRLRRSLERYYLLAGQQDPVRIEIPKGSYVAAFQPQAGSAPTAAPGISAANGANSNTSASRIPAGEHLGISPAPAASALSPLARLRLPPRPALVGGLSLLMLTLVLVLLAWQPWRGASHLPAAGPPSLMVLPFDDLSSEPWPNLAEGVAQEVLFNLIRFKEFVVFDARTSFSAGQDSPFELARRLEADYVVIGSVQRDAARIRVSAQLVKLATGASIWTATYEEELAGERLFEIQGGIAASIAAAVAQPYGVIYRDTRDQLQRHPPHSLTVYECLLQAYAYRRNLAAAPHASVRGCLEDAVLREPDYADAMAMLAMVYVDEFRWRFNPRPDQYDPLDQALLMARRAVDAAPDNASGWLALFETHFFRGDLEPAFAAGEKAVALNPSNPELQALVGMRLAHAGQWDLGVAMMEEALRLNPAPPGWYYFGLSVNAFRQHDDEAALAWADKIDMPGFFWTHALLAAIHGQLGRRDAAAGAVRRLLALYPEFESRALIELRRQHFEPAVFNRMVESLGKAGLNIPAASASAEGSAKDKL